MKSLTSVFNPKVEPDKTIRFVMQHSLEFDDFCSDYSSIDKPKFNPQQIIILLDISGSTNNNDSSLKIFQNQHQIQFENQPKMTPPIIIAECEGICTVLLEYMRLFDMTDTHIFLIPFSTKFQVFKFIAESNQHLYDKFLTQLDLIDYEQAGTNLFEPMEYVCNSILSSNIYTHIILATDGQTNKQEKVLELMNSIKCKFSIFIIGAGSIHESMIRESNGYQTRSCAYGIVNPRDHSGQVAKNTTIKADLLMLTLEQLIDKIFIDKIISESQQFELFKPPIRTGSSIFECDINYLEQLAYIKSAIIGYYCGAFGDYQVLKKSAVEYLEAIMLINKQITFKVLLDDGQYGLLPEGVSEMLLKYSSVMCKTQYGYYIITCKWQIAVKPLDFPISETTVAFNSDDSFFKLEYDELKNKEAIHMRKFKDISYVPLTDSRKLYRIRRIVCV